MTELTESETAGRQAVQSALHLARIPASLKQPASGAVIVNRCAVCQEHVLIHQIRQCCVLLLTVDDPFLQ
ncbi:TPA: hypothetical protein HI077_004736, partial [Escherichia coli]|nr:hypothetical protein [Escherichia coli]